MLSDLQEQLQGLSDCSVHNIRVEKHRNSYQYYIRTDKNDTSGKYVPKAQITMAENIIKKEYLENMLKSVQSELKAIDFYLKKNNPGKLVTNYEHLHKGRKRFINPFETDDEEFIQKWLSVQYNEKYFTDDSYEYYTDRNEKVRSKSELIIANMLNKYSIPYRYEYPIRVKGMGTVYPDFITLNVRRRKEIYWEHLGLIDNEDYRTMAIRKMESYEKTDIFLGDNLIVTLETAHQPLSTIELERKIHKYLL